MQRTTPRRDVESGPVQALKRFFIGEPLHTERLAHERLGKPTALAVFASDNLSSSAYATEEILRVLLPIGVAAFALVVPITIALLLVLGTLLFSYRQTIKAYPQAGGAYLVTKDNFGLFPAQIAGVALLTDYILTVSVSVAAGTAALTSAAPGLFEWRVPIAVGCIVIIAWGNLRGVKESGRIFAVPTYFFIAMMFVLLGTGFYGLVTGSLHHVRTFPIPSKGLEAASLYLVLKAFASGGAAVTGVEAISNGVPAFKPPEWINARTTLMWMGALLGTMFLGLSLLASRIHVAPDPEEKVTILSQVARAVFGSTAGGHAMFLALQIGTLLILVLAANTSYADFPRLASFLAADRSLPGQLTQYGDRLVFSNGILVLTGLASLLVIVFKASVTKLIPLYAIGVFTSFTFSQAGMSVRHRRLKEPGWRIGLAINGFGAVVSGVMTLVIAVAKFPDGAWIILLTTPILVATLVRIHRHYAEVARLLRLPERRPSVATRPVRAIIAVDKLGAADRYAAAYAAKIRPVDIRVVHVGSTDYRDLLTGWSELGSSNTLEVVSTRTTLARDLLTYIRGYKNEVHPDEFVNVIIPEAVRDAGVGHLVRRSTVQLLKATLAREPDVVITNVTWQPGHPAPEPGAGDEWRHVVVVLVSSVHNATLNALRYARSLHSDQLRCVHVEIESRATEKVVNDWELWRPGSQLEVISSPYRQLARPLLDFVRGLLDEEPRTVVTIVIPEFVLTKWWHNILHNHAALQLKRAFLFEPSVVVTAVPYRLGGKFAVTGARDTASVR
jgi:amino acid transporter